MGHILDCRVGLFGKERKRWGKGVMPKQEKKKKKKAIKTKQTGLPWWGDEFPCPCRRQEFAIWSGKIPHASEQPSPRTTTTEPVL